MKKLIASILLASLFGILPAQVTIGLDKASVDGALLQIKDKEVTDGAANAKGGFGIPRVQITTLTPAENRLAESIGNTSGDTPWDKDVHIGLMVYNINECVVAANGDRPGKGLYVWDGVEWQPITKDAQVLVSLQAETATNASREDWKTAWGKQVIRHQAKAGVYEAFFSADFGAAGRWMTTNLSATAYDGVKHSQDPTRTLTGPHANPSNAYDVAYWVYPNIDGGDPTDPTEYNKNKSIGYLYTWDAATAGKGGLDGLHNIYNPISMSESGLPEGSAAGQQQRIQGVCPQGWHLPSDYEWTLLEQEIIKQTTVYANVTQNINSQYPTELAQVPQNTEGDNGWRGSYQGTAMKEVCKTYTNDPVGSSKTIGQGGFAGFMAGFASGTISHYYGTNCYFCSSSSNSIIAVWYRNLAYNKGGVSLGGIDRRAYTSIRCKKDDK